MRSLLRLDAISAQLKWGNLRAKDLASSRVLNKALETRQRLVVLPKLADNSRQLVVFHAQHGGHCLGGKANVASYVDSLSSQGQSPGDQFQEILLCSFTKHQSLCQPSNLLETNVCIKCQIGRSVKWQSFFSPGSGRLRCRGTSRLNARIPWPTIRQLARIYRQFVKRHQRLRHERSYFKIDQHE